MNRKMLKTITWSATAFVITFAVGMVLTGDPVKGGAVAVLCRVLKFPAYWLHETLYERSEKAESVELVAETA